MGNRKEIEVFWRRILGTTPVLISDQLLKNQVTDQQNQIIDIVYKAFVENIAPKALPLAYGGKLDDEIIKKYQSNLIERIKELSTDESNLKEYLSLINKYCKLLEDLIPHYLGMHIRLRDLPIPHLYFLSQPRILWPSEKLDRMNIEPNGFTISTSIQGVVPYDLLIGKTKNDYTFCFKYPSEEGLIEALNLNPKLVSYKHPDLITNFILDITRSRFDGLIDLNKGRSETELDPFSAHLMGDHALTTNLKELQVFENYEIRKKKSGIIGLIYRLKTESILILYTEEAVSMESVLRVTTALSHLAISCYEFPRTRIIKRKTTSSRRFESEADRMNVSSGESYSKPIYEVWTEGELEELAAKRGLLNLPVWKENELEELAAQRGIIQLPEWTEEELSELSSKKPVQDDRKSRATWTPPSEEHPCPKCEYELNPEWSSCPICGGENPFYSKPSSTSDSSKNKEDDEKIWRPPQSG